MATYTSNYAWTKPEGGDPVDIGVLNNNLDSQDNIVHNAYMQLAPVFSSASTYAVDDVVLYSNNLYKCHTAVTVAGDWTGATNWTQVKVSDICGCGGTSDYTQLSNKPSVNNITLVGNKTGTQLGLQNTGEASIGVEELIRDTIGRTGKNLMVYPYYEGTEEEQGVTFTDNGDGTITLSGTSSASAYHFLERDSSLYLKAGDYILSGGILNAWLYLYTNSGTEIDHTNNSDTSVKVTIPSDGYYRVSLVIPANKTFSNVTCYPMIRHAEVVDDTYESYYPPIEDELEKLKIQLSVMPTASATYDGKIVQFVGTTDATYTHGYYYECANNGGTYTWTQLNVQPSSGGGTSDYTDLTNKPQINDVTLEGNKSASDLGLMNTNGSNASNNVKFKNGFTVGIRNSSISVLGVASVSEGGVDIIERMVPNPPDTGNIRYIIRREEVYLPDKGIALTLRTYEPGTTNLISSTSNVYFSDVEEDPPYIDLIGLIDFEVTVTHYYNQIVIQFSRTNTGDNNSCIISFYTASMGNTASGVNSHASGIGLVASEPNSFVVGKYNDTNNSADKIFVVGNGDSNLSRSNAFAVGLTGGIEEKGTAYTMRGILDGEIYKADGTSGAFVELEDGAVYLFTSVTRLISTGAWRGMNNYVIATQFNPSTGAGTGSSTTAQGAPQITAIGAAGTVGLTMAKLTYQDSSNLYHSKIGFGSCTTNCQVRWSLKKLCGSETEF